MDEIVEASKRNEQRYRQTASVSAVFAYCLGDTMGNNAPVRLSRVGIHAEKYTQIDDDKTLRVSLPHFPYFHHIYIFAKIYIVVLS